MIFKSKIKWAALGGLLLSFVSLLIHLLLAKYSSADFVQYSVITDFAEDFSINAELQQGPAFRWLWGNEKYLQSLHPYANPRSRYPGPSKKSNGFIYAKVYGEFEEIRTSICDLVVVSRLLNATLVIPEIQKSTRAKGVSIKFKSFSYLYSEDQFIAALSKDVTIVKSLPENLKEIRKKKQFPTFKPKHSATPSFYVDEVLPQLRKRKVIGLVLTDGGCLQSVLPSSLDEYQRLRCRVAFHALQFRPEILALGHRMIERLRATGKPYLAYHPGLTRDALAYHGCAELFQDVHTELIQYRRSQMIKEGILNEELGVDSHMRKANGSCPLMPEEVGLLLRAMGYPPRTRIYLAGSEIFGGQRSLIPLRAMYTNLVDRTSLCSKLELSEIVGPETPLPSDTIEHPPPKSAEELKKEWNKAGPRPRPLPPPPDRPFYRHEKEGWYGWISEKDSEPEPSAIDLRQQAHRLLWAALDYIVSVEADAFFPGFDNDGSGWPDFSGLVMGHRLYEMASVRTYRPDRKYLAKLFSGIADHLYYPKRNWTILVRKHLRESLREEGLLRENKLVKPISFLAHPIPECSCRSSKSAGFTLTRKGSKSKILHGSEIGCPKWIESSIPSVDAEDSTDESQDYNLNLQGLMDFDDRASATDSTPSVEQDEEMDPDD